MLKHLKTLWQILRRLSGDDAYERYLAHYDEYHHGECGHALEEPLSRAEFFKQAQERKWNGIKRCC